MGVGTGAKVNRPMAFGSSTNVATDLISSLSQFEMMLAIKKWKKLVR
jgi:hypothetical protein